MPLSILIGAGLGVAACVVHLAFAVGRAWLRARKTQGWAEGLDWWLLPAHLAVPTVLGFLALVQGPVALVSFAVTFFAVRAAVRWFERRPRAEAEQEPAQGA
jgi:hypothetical protein